MERRKNMAKNTENSRSKAKNSNRPVKKTTETKKESKVSKTKKVEEQSTKMVEHIEEEQHHTGMNETTRGIILGVVITSLIFSIIILLILARSGNSTSTSGKVKRTSGDSEMLTSFHDAYESEEPTLIVFARSTCGWCELQKPIVERINEDYHINYLFMDYLQLNSQEELNTVGNLLAHSAMTTPYSAIVKNGTILKTLDGFADTQEYVDFLISGGVLPSGSVYKDETRLTSISYDKFKELLAGKETVAILFDAYSNGGETVLDRRKEINTLAEQYDVDIYHLSALNMSQSVLNEFIEKLGDWGYDAKIYKEEQKVDVSILFIVKNGKIVWYGQSDTSKSNLEENFKKYLAK